MKKIILSAIVILFFAMVSCAQTKFYKQMTGQKDIECVYISTTMLKLLPREKIDVDVNGLNMSGIWDKMTSMEVITAERADKKDYLKNEVDNLIENSKYQTVLINAEGEETVGIYAKISNREGAKSVLMIVTSEPDEINVVRMIGNYTAQDLQLDTDGDLDPDAEDSIE